MDIEYDASDGFEIVSNSLVKTWLKGDGIDFKIDAKGTFTTSGNGDSPYSQEEDIRRQQLATEAGKSVLAMIKVFSDMTAAFSNLIQ